MVFAGSPIAYSLWVEPGKLLAGEYPGPLRLGEDGTKIAALLAARVTCFLDLTHPEDGLEPYDEEMARQAEALGRRVARRAVPIPDFGVPSRETMKSILDTLITARLAGEVVYVHCWGGIGRTGTVIGCYLARHGVCGDDALAELARLRSAWPDGREAPETHAQREFVRRWLRGT